MTDTEYLVTNSVTTTPDSHDVILQTLNQWREVVDGNGVHRPVYFGAGAFDGTEWDGVPVIYTEHGHPATPFQDDPILALQSCKGKIVGSFHNGKVDSTGSTKYTGQVQFTDDFVDAMHARGELALSSGFYSHFDKSGKLAGKVKPDHIIVFHPTETFRPQDLGAMFLNATTEPEPPKPDFRASVSRIVGMLQDLLAGNMDEPVNNATYKGYVPKNPAGYNAAPIDTSWSAPNLSDFTDKQWVDLSASERAKIGQCYAYVGDPDDFSTLALPHHDPKTGDVVWEAVTSAIAALNGARGATPVPNDKKADVKAHLEAHYKDFDKEPVNNSTDPAMTATEARAGGGDTMSEELTKQISDLTATIGEKDAALTEISAKMATMEGQMKSFLEAEEKRKVDELDAKWAKVKAEVLLPGQTHKPEDEARLKEMFIKNPQDFVLNAMTKPRVPDTGSTGAKFVTNSTQEPDEADTLVSELKATAGRMR